MRDRRLKRAETLAPMLVAIGLLILPGAAVGSTRVIRYDPFTSEGDVAPKYTTSTRGGDCWTTSSVAARPDAWRCMTGNRIYDPCFESPVYDLAVCPGAPWEERVVVLDPVTFEGPPSDYAYSLPWAVRLTSGKGCVFVSGATVLVRGRPLRYVCGRSGRGPFLFGAPDRRKATWKMWYAKSAQGRGWKRVKIARAWK
jgi:hypothetical protein